MNKLLRYSALAVFVGAGVGVAHADEATTTGGIKIKSSDGNFDASLGGRIHFDGEVIVPDHGAKFGVNDPAGGEKSSFYFRRVFISLAGHLYGWEYHIDEDLASTNTNGFNDVWIAHSVFGGDTIYLGQHKVWRSLDELASNNINPFIERNANSSTGGGSLGINANRDFADGVFYKWTHSFTGSDNFFGGASFYTLGKAATLSSGGGTQTQGTGYNVRIAYAPIVKDTMWLHLGTSASVDNADDGSTLSSGYFFVGRQATGATLASYTASAPGVGGGNPNVTSIAGELAGAFGPAYVQAEFTNNKYNQNGVAPNTVQAFSGTAAWAITGETRPYDKGVATYGNIKPKHSYGALEVAARFDFMRNDCAGGVCVGAAKALTGSATPAVTAAHLSSFTAGVNYYVNPAVRFMVDYMHGSANGTLAGATGGSGKDSPNSYEARVQIAF